MSKVDDTTQDDMDLQHRMADSDSERLQEDMALDGQSADALDDEDATTPAGPFHEAIGPLDAPATGADDWEAADPDMAEMPYPADTTEEDYKTDKSA